MIKRNILDLLIGLTTAIIIFNFYHFTKELSLGQYSDWLINYQGGFVRRGLIGEILFQIHSILSIRLDLVIFITVSLLYIFFYINFSKIIKTLNFSFLNLLIIFSPLSFVWPVMEEKASGRKDILYLFFLSLIALNLKKINFYRQKYLIILLSAIAVFSHTGFLFLIPSFLIIYLLCNSDKKVLIIFKEIFFIILSLFIFLIILLNNTQIGPEQIKLICDSVTEFVRSDCTTIGYIATLSWSFELNLDLKKSLWMTDHYHLFFSLAFLICFLPLLIVFHFSKFSNFKRFNVLSLFSLFLAGTIPLYYVGVDYGRYLHLTYLTSIIIYAVALQNKVIIFNLPKNNYFKKFTIKPFILVFVIFLYGFTFTVPHCCNNNFKFNYKKLVLKINEKLN
tara:strand:- start:947 stop:2125 length:1179 start_codon:yes stop_codon:yes gene_type:complete